MVGGYAGKFLRADLTLERLSDEVFDEAVLRKYLGGTGIGVKILYEWSPPWNGQLASYRRRDREGTWEGGDGDERSIHRPCR